MGFYNLASDGINFADKKLGEMLPVKKGVTASEIAVSAAEVGLGVALILGDIAKFEAGTHADEVKEIATVRALEALYGAEFVNGAIVNIVDLTIQSIGEVGFVDFIKNLSEEISDLIRSSKGKWVSIKTPPNLKPTEF